MSTRIRVLGIVPYESMKPLMAKVAEEYPQIDLTIFVGDREQGLAIARSNFHGNYDAVISRGNTATVLRENLPLPVIEIGISVSDILCTLRLAEGLEKVALFSSANIAENARTLGELMNYHMDIYTYDSPDAVEETLLRMQGEHYQAILCDMAVNTAAKRLGMNAFLITSSVDSVRKALDQAVLLCRSQRHLRDENLFFRELLHGQIGQTVVFDREGTLYLSTLDDPTPELLDLLRRELPESWREAERRITRNLGGMLYSIRSKRITADDEHTFVAFFVDARKTPLSPTQVGIRFSTRPEAENAFYDSIFSFAGTIGDFQEEITKISQSNAPVMVTGEDGTGKESMVSALYLRSLLQNNPLVSINCSMLNSKSWDFLMEHHNSPLSGEGNTLYFASIDVLSNERRQQLLAVLSEMNVCRRNRVLFSCVCQPGEYTSATGALFMDKLCCLSLYLPPLRQLASRIPTLVNLTLSHLNAGLAHQITGAEPEALRLLQEFPWPHNYTQFRRVIGDLAVTAPGQTISAEDVRQLLRKERHVGAFSLRAENVAAPLDLNRTLDEINQDVAMRVVAEANGNQTLAAKRLGISRTTLWRLMQK